MAKLVMLLEQHLDRLLPTVVLEATYWWEAQLTLVKLQKCGLGVHLPVKVHCYYLAYVYVQSGVKHTTQLSAHFQETLHLGLVGV